MTKIRKPIRGSQTYADMANQLEKWGNQRIAGYVGIFSEGWSGSSSSISYAIASTGSLTRGSISVGDNDLEWLSSLWGDLTTELNELLKLASIDRDIDRFKSFLRVAEEVEFQIDSILESYEKSGYREYRDYQCNPGIYGQWVCAHKDYDGPEDNRIVGCHENNLESEIDDLIERLS